MLIDVAAADGRFAGATEVYAGPSVAEHIASALDGFPRSPTDRREVTLGSLDPRVAGGWVQLAGRCVDRAGHAVIEVALSDKYPADGLSPRTAHVHLRTEPPAVDEFIRALRAWDCRLGSAVTLRGAT